MQSRIILVLIFVLTFVWAAINRDPSNRKAWSNSEQSLTHLEQEIIVDENLSTVAFQQSVDHFSNDARAMSPRSWGNFYEGASNEPVAPQVTFETGNPVETPVDSKQQSDQGLFPAVSPMQQVENSSVREPKPFFEQNPLDPNSNALDSSEYSSPLPLELGKQKDRQLKSRLEQKPDQKGANHIQPGASPTPDAIIADPSPAFAPKLEWFERNESDSEGYGRDNYRGSFWGSAQIYNQDDYGSYQPKRSCACKRCRINNRKRIRSNSKQGECFCENDCGRCCPQPKYNQHLGHRYEFPLTRGELESSATKFTFEEDGDFPPASEILSQSIFWSELDFMFLQPAFQGNTAITVSGPSGISQPFNFDLEPGFRVSAGFESEYGPGFAADYFQFDNNSDVTGFTSDGVLTGASRVYQLGPNVWTELIADDLGESLDTFHSLEVHSTGVYAFKAIKFKRAYVNGRFGVQVVSVEQIMRATLTDSVGTELGQLNHRSNIEAFGPRFGIDYVRKIGHTPAQLITSATTSLLFGDRDQFVENTYLGNSSQVGADEFLSVFDIFFGVQGKRIRGEKRNTTFRVGFVNQTWFGGGTGIDPSGDFGFQGLSFMFGLNR